jgi:antitoxin component of MazEF toxin-antitoxin module
MPTKYTVTLSYMGTSSVIAIPKPIIQGFDLKKGQTLEMLVTDKGIYIPLAQPTKQDKKTEALIREVKSLE